MIDNDLFISSLSSASKSFFYIKEFAKCMLETMVRIKRGFNDMTTKKMKFTCAKRNEEMP